MLKTGSIPMTPGLKERHRHVVEKLWRRLVPTVHHQVHGHGVGHGCSVCLSCMEHCSHGVLTIYVWLNRNQTVGHRITVSGGRWWVHGGQVVRALQNLWISHWWVALRQGSSKCPPRGSWRRCSGSRGVMWDTLRSWRRLRGAHCS